MKIKININNSKMKASKLKDKQADKMIDGFFDAVKNGNNLNVIVKKEHEDVRAIKEIAIEHQAIEMPKEKNQSIRVRENGQKIYRTDYVCPACEKTGYRFAAQNRHYIKCHVCHTKIAIHSAVEGNKDRLKEPKIDENGAYFIANQLYK